MREWVCVDPPANRRGAALWQRLIADAYDYGCQLTAKSH